jgi:uncharacterized membrane protein
MKNLLTLLAVAAFAFSIMALTQTLPQSVQLVINDMAEDIMPSQKSKLSETQNYRLDAASEASFK